MRKRYILNLCCLLMVCVVLSACGPVAPAVTTGEPQQSTTAPTTVPATTPPTTEAPTTVPTEPEIEWLGGLTGDEVFDFIFSLNDCMRMSLHFADGSTYGPYTVLKRPHNMRLRTCIETEAPTDFSAYNEWLVLESGDGTARLTVYRGTPDLLCYEENGSTYYYLDGEEGEEGRTEQSLRWEFDSTEKLFYGRLSFASEATGKAVLNEFMNTVFPEYRMNLSPGSTYRITDYDVISCELTEDNGNIVIGTASYAIKLDRTKNNQSLGFSEIDGEGKYEGWYLYDMNIVLEKQGDGIWYRLDSSDYRAAGWEDEYVPPETPDPRAQIILESVPEKLAQLQALAQTDPEACLIGISDLFLTCTTAVPMSGNLDFDWYQFTTEDAFDHIGMQSMLNNWVERNGKRGFLRSDWDYPIPYTFVKVDGDKALVYHSEIQIYYQLVDGKWLICDTVNPYAGT